MANRIQIRIQKIQATQARQRNLVVLSWFGWPSFFLVAAGEVRKRVSTASGGGGGVTR